MELREQNLVIDCTDMVSLRGDEYWLREAVGNIVKNCMEHTPAGGGDLHSGSGKSFIYGNYSFG